MRQSLLDIAESVRNIPYPHPLPSDLVPYHAYIMDSGHCICVIPKSVIPPGVSADKLWRYEAPVPAKYVLQNDYEWIEGNGERFILMDVPYSNDIGVDVPEEYEEFASEPDKPRGLFVIKKGMSMPGVFRAPDGVQLRFTEDGALLICMYRTPSSVEKSQFSKGSFQIGTYYEDGIVFLLIKPGKERWQDHPYLPKNEEAGLLSYLLHSEDATLPITVALADTATGKIVSDVREFTLPSKFVRSIAEMGVYLLERRKNAMSYLRDAQIIQSIYESEQMAERGITYTL